MSLIDKGRFSMIGEPYKYINLEIILQWLCGVASERDKQYLYEFLVANEEIDTEYSDRNNVVTQTECIKAVINYLQFRPSEIRKESAKFDANRMFEIVNECKEGE